jgi:hypothetical protein
MQLLDQCLAFGPLAIYLLLLGIINLSRRPMLVSGTRDIAALGLAVSGLVLVGPLALFFPENAALRLGPNGPKYVWAMLAALYALGLASGLLFLRPRLVIYNISADRLRPILAELVEELDPHARWAGDSLVLPGLDVQLHLDNTAWMRNVVLASGGPKQDERGWQRLEKALAAALAGVDVPRNPRGMTLFTMGLFVLGVLAWGIAHDSQTLARTLFDLLQL